jgi:hypothetical protein
MDYDFPSDPSSIARGRRRRSRRDLPTVMHISPGIAIVVGREGATACPLRCNRQSRRPGEDDRPADGNRSHGAFVRPIRAGSHRRTQLVPACSLATLGRAVYRSAAKRL